MFKHFTHISRVPFHFSWCKEDASNSNHCMVPFWQLRTMKLATKKLVKGQASVNIAIENAYSRWKWTSIGMEWRSFSSLMRLTWSLRIFIALLRSLTPNSKQSFATNLSPYIEIIIEKELSLVWCRGVLIKWLELNHFWTALNQFDFWIKSVRLNTTKLLFQINLVQIELVAKLVGLT